MGWRKPVIALSNWLLENLDEQEIAATVAHELAHIRRQDTLLMFWVHSLCPGGFGLPPLRRQIRHLTVLVENRADTMSAGMTGNALALASALTKVGRHLASPRSAPVLSLTGNGSPPCCGSVSCCCWESVGRSADLTWDWACCSQVFSPEPLIWLFTPMSCLRARVCTAISIP